MLKGENSWKGFFMSREALTDCKAIGAKIKALRKEQGVTQAQLAGLSNTGVRFICDLENGKPTCQIGKILNVLITLGVDIHIYSPYEEYDK
jgi:y4mF family transcriptional regulator